MNAPETFIRWVRYQAWLLQSGFQPMSWFEYLRLQGQRS